MKRILHSPFAIGCIYLAAVPLFALAYATMWTDLLQVTAKDDRATVNLNHIALLHVNRILGEILATNRNLPVSGYGGYIGSAEPPSHFDFAFNAYTPTKLGLVTGILSIDTPLEAVATNLGPVSVNCRIVVSPPDLAESYEAALKAVSGSNFKLIERKGETLFGELTLPPEVILALQRYQAVVQGRPAPVGGGFGRYLYFSIVTITTLGYGDIVPLTDRARYVVGAEALFGVVVAGLFVNAVAKRAGGNYSEGKRSDEIERNA